MSKRYRDAIAISEGACNPSGIAHSIVSACKEARDEGQQTHNDPAIRLMVSQLAYICGVWDGISPWTMTTIHGQPHVGDWHEMTKVCEAKAEAETAQTAAA